MSERSNTISRLIESADFRASYLRAKLNINIPSQIHALRRRQDLTQVAFAEEAGMKQSRISAMERPGETKFNLETLIRVAAAFKVGLIVRFAPFSDVLRWENGFSQDDFDVLKIDDDAEFLAPTDAVAHAGSVPAEAFALLTKAFELIQRRGEQGPLIRLANLRIAPKELEKQSTTTLPFQPVPTGGVDLARLPFLAWQNPYPKRSAVTAENQSAIGSSKQIPHELRA